MNRRIQRLNSREIAKEIFGGTMDDTRGEWMVRGVKKANAIFAAQGREALIFTGRYSTPAAVEQWLAAHPDFIAGHVIRKKSAAEPAIQVPDTHRPHRQVAV